jgi:hypothetical protein
MAANFIYTIYMFLIGHIEVAIFNLIVAIILTILLVAIYKKDYLK